MSIKFEALNSSPRFYDKEDYDKINYEKIQNQNQEFGIKTTKVIPSEGEVRLLGNRHFDCKYYSTKLDLCMNKVNNDNRKSFIGCKQHVDSMYRCYTNNSDVKEYNNIRLEAKPYMKSFFDCIFKKERHFDMCMSHFEDSIRVVYRSNEN